MDQSEIIRLFERRDESAISLAEQTYGGYCASIIRSILPSAQDVEEILSDTLLRAWRTIPPQKPSCLKFYLARIARNLAFDRYRTQTREKRGGTETDLALDELAHCVPAPGDVEDQISAAELQRSIDQFLQTLPERERGVFLRRYFFVEDIGTIAARFGVKEGNVRTILARTRKKLKRHLEKEGYHP